MEIAKLTLRPAGMFSNVNEVIQQLYLAEQNGYKFAIDWSSSCYKEPQRKIDPWNYYFKDCFLNLGSVTKPLRHLPCGERVACAKGNIITPRIEDGNCIPLLLPKDRKLPHRIIKRFIALQPGLQRHISEYALKHFQSYTIGLHIRGPGRTDGGVLEMRNRLSCEYGVPFEQYLKLVDKHLISHPEAKTFACSDSAFVIRKIALRYGEKVITYAATRSTFGEMHLAGHPENAGEIFPKYKLGEDVIIEAYALSQTNFFIHGNSNVANFILCKNPLLPHKYVDEVSMLHHASTNTQPLKKSL